MTYTYKKLSFHPAADIFPLMAGAEFDALVADTARKASSTSNAPILNGKGLWAKAMTAPGVEAALSIVDAGIATTEIFDGLGASQAEVISREARRKLADSGGDKDAATRVASGLANGMREASDAKKKGDKWRRRAVTRGNARHVADKIAPTPTRRKPKSLPDINRAAEKLTAKLNEVCNGDSFDYRLESLSKFCDEESFSRDEQRKLKDALSAVAKRFERFAGAFCIDAPTPSAQTVLDPIDKELELLREFATFVASRWSKVSFSSQDNAEWKLLLGKVQEALGVTS